MKIIQQVLTYAIMLVVLITSFNALVYFGMGIYFSIESYIELSQGKIDYLPGIALLESLDRFLIGFVFIIVSVGMSKLFLANTFFDRHFELDWFKINDFNQLKMILMSASLVALFVAWIPEAVRLINATEKDWAALLLPVGILILAVAARFIKDIH